MDLTAALDEFAVDQRLAGRSSGTINKHLLELRRLARWLDTEQQDWQQLTRRILQQYVRQRADKAFSTRSNMFCTLRVFFDWATVQDYTQSSPAAGFRTPTRPRPVPRSLNRDQVRVLVAELGRAQTLRAQRDRALILTGLYAGLRAAELAALRWPAVDFAGATITIRLSKMGHGRTVPLHQVLADELRAWRDALAPAGDVAVFGLAGATIKPNQVNRIVRAVAHAAGLRCTTHQLRHSFATWMLRSSSDLYAVSKALGHSRIAQTEIYLSADPEQIRDSLDTLPGLDSW